MIIDTSYGIMPLKRSDKGGYQILIIQHRNGSFWGFPKGHKDSSDQSDIDAACRELLEETSLRVIELLNNDPYVEYYIFKSGGKQIAKTVYFYPALVEGEFKKQDEEIYAGRWVPLKQALHELTYPEAKAICQQLITFLGEHP